MKCNVHLLVVKVLKNCYISLDIINTVTIDCCNCLRYHDVKEIKPRVLVQELRSDREVVWQAGGCWLVYFIETPKIKMADLWIPHDFGNFQM